MNYVFRKIRKGEVWVGIILSESKFIPDDIRRDVGLLQEQVLSINQIYQQSYSKWLDEFYDWLDEQNDLRKKIEHFNSCQISRVCHNSTIRDTKVLLSAYMERYEYIQASMKFSKGEKHNCFITYRSRIMGFSEFFRAQTALYNQYSMFRKYISSLSYCVYENSKKPVNGKYLLGVSHSDGSNPYTIESIAFPIDKTIKLENVVTIKHVKDYLYGAFKKLFGEDILAISSKIVRNYLWNVCAKLSVESLIDSLFITYVYTQKGMEWGGIEFRPDGYISRHIAWCQYRRNDGACILLDQPCHSSVDCAFYREKNTINANLARTSFADD